LCGRKPASGRGSENAPDVTAKRGRNLHTIKVAHLQRPFFELFSQKFRIRSLAKKEDMKKTYRIDPGPGMSLAAEPLALAAYFLVKINLNHIAGISFFVDRRSTNKSPVSILTGHLKKGVSGKMAIVFAG